jgi:V8-like Glu-specific endopeptidase
MTHFLDTLPFDWSQPAARELRDFLASTYFRVPPVIELVQQAGIKVAAIGWDQPMQLVWHDVIQQARNEDRLRKLLQQIMESGDTAVSVRLREFLDAAPVVASPAAEPGPGTWKGFGDHDALERLIVDESTLLDIAFLRRGIELSAAVARLLVTVPNGDRYYGTAFRISDDLLLTNHHVLYERTSEAPASAVEAWFGYENDVAGQLLAPTVVTCLPETIVGDKQRDWAVIRVATAMPPGTPVIELDRAAPVRPDDRVYIIQHPNGGTKKIGMIHNVVRYVDNDVIQYWTDTEAGSSGSPVFNERWHLVALHHRWVVLNSGGTTEYRNQGQRISRVAEGLTAAGLL